ncbi:MAG: glutamate-1-semialdehyde 2,1-aminomutase [Actinomycetota bacterium]|nr:glutamate-1-semialdehyde 2,1-aminomutase [Actinomycetota bacterium]
MTDDDLRRRLQRAIPGGAHTYSRGIDQFPSNAPALLVRGHGAYVWDADGNRYLDYGMGLRSVSLGYGRPEVVDRVRSALDLGNNLTMSSMLELEAAEYLIELIDSVDMVKFAKHGSTVTTGAVKLARGATGRSLVCVTRQHPFHSFDDWFIGSTVMSRGIPEEVKAGTLRFDYGDIASLQALFTAHPGEIAAVVLEPAVTASPCPKACPSWPSHGPACGSCANHQENFLVQVRRLCDQQGALMILDEIITAFRWHTKGAQHQFGVIPDLSTFGKGMANGFAMAALGGKREYMDLGGIHKEGAERLFLMSTTHGPEMVGTAAFLGTMQVYESVDVCGHLWDFGAAFRRSWDRLAASHGVGDYLVLEGPSVSLSIVARDAAGEPSGHFKALFAQEMVRAGVLMPWLAPSLAHGDTELELTERALDSTFQVYAKALADGPETYLEGPPLKPVFRRNN